MCAPQPDVIYSVAWKRNVTGHCSYAHIYAHVNVEPAKRARKVTVGGNAMTIDIAISVDKSILTFN